MQLYNPLRKPRSHQYHCHHPHQSQQNLCHLQLHRLSPSWVIDYHYSHFGQLRHCDHSLTVHQCHRHLSTSMALTANTPDVLPSNKHLRKSLFAIILTPSYSILEIKLREWSNRIGALLSRASWHYSWMVAFFLFSNSSSNLYLYSGMSTGIGFGPMTRAETRESSRKAEICPLGIGAP